MFVYLLHHSTEPRFKIGKANDIYLRILGLGGVDNFNLTNSLCIQLPSEELAYRLEKVLHRLFGPWKFPVDENSRYPGDTEQFDINCFGRLLKFLGENSDLTLGSLPMPLPALPERPLATTKIVLSREERFQRRLERELQEQQSVNQKFDAAVEKIESGISKLLEMDLDVFEICSLPYRYIVIESSDPDKFEIAHSIVDEWIPLVFSPRKRRGEYSSFITGMSATWDYEKVWGRIDCSLNRFIVDGTMTGFDKEIVRIVEMIPETTSYREPLSDDWLWQPELSDTSQVTQQA